MRKRLRHVAKGRPADAPSRRRGFLAFPGRRSRRRFHLCALRHECGSRRSPAARRLALAPRIENRASAAEVGDRTRRRLDGRLDQPPAVLRRAGPDGGLCAGARQPLRQGRSDEHRLGDDRARDARRVDPARRRRRRAVAGQGTRIHRRDQQERLLLQRHRLRRRRLFLGRHDGRAGNAAGPEVVVRLGGEERTQVHRPGKARADRAGGGLRRRGYRGRPFSSPQPDRGFRAVPRNGRRAVSGQEARLHGVGLERARRAAGPGRADADRRASQPRGRRRRHSAEGLAARHDGWTSSQAGRRLRLHLDAVRGRSVRQDRRRASSIRAAAISSTRPPPRCRSSSKD